MAYIPRLTAPTYDDLKQINIKYGGGLNHALTINKTTGSVLPNCTGYVHFRALELCGPEIESKLCLYNAVAYFDYTADGLERGQTPRLGAIAVWSGGSKGYGHVAVVETLYSDGSFLCSNSNYSGTRFYTKRVYAPSYQPWSGYKLLGFIYLPWDKPLSYVGTPVERDSTKYQCEVIYGALRARKRPEMNEAVILGYANKGVYDVLETKDMTAEASNGYFWYRVEPEMWIARKDGELTEDYPAAVEDVDELKKKVAALTAEVETLNAANATLTNANAELSAKITAAVDILE